MSNIASNLSANYPITSLQEDMLVYSPFAKIIAIILNSAKNREDCLLLGIHGE